MEREPCAMGDDNHTECAIAAFIREQAAKCEAVPGRCTIAEQVIEDKVAGLTITVKSLPTGGSKIELEGACLPHGNRDYSFGEEGGWTGQGSRLVP